MRLRFILPFLFAPVLLANTPPAAPVFIEPDSDDRVISAADVHMATMAFSDADGDGHRCSDWQILQESEVVWQSLCASGPEAVHIHLGDGQFVGSHAGRNELFPDRAYIVRVRFRDDSGDPATEWSGWTERAFRTAIATFAAPLMLRDVSSVPSSPAVPAGASLRLEATDAALLVRISATGVLDAPPLPSSSAVRVVLEAGASGWTFPETDLRITDESNQPHTIYLPAITLGANETRHYWVSANGSTHTANVSDRAPDFEHIVRGNPVPWTARRGFVVERVATGFQLPTNITFVPNPLPGDDSPLFYVNELYGDIKVVTRSGEVRTYATGLVDFDPTGIIPGSGELGLADLAVDAITGDVFATTVYWPDRSIPEAYGKIVRLHSLDGGLTAASRETILAMPGERQASSHQISNISIGPDGKLYVHMGDGQQIARSQDLTAFRGKILRVNLDGSAPSDNPFYNAADGITATDYVFAYGFRNPFGGGWRASDQSLYEIENGPAVDRFARVVRGRNYLWDGTNDSMRNYALQTYGTGSAPVHAEFIQAPTFGGSGFPASLWDHAFVTLSGATWASGPQPPGKRISELVLGVNADGSAEERTFLEYNGTGKGTVVGLAAGPDGLYFTDLYKDYGYETPIDRGASVFRVRWVGPETSRRRAVRH
ncbi:MAG: PQQ-dependent sugar dehydrogenase [Thermoanaerobaculia bacterium]